MVEIGPFGVNPDGKTLYTREHAWTQGRLSVILLFSMPIVFLSTFVPMYSSSYESFREMRNSRNDLMAERPLKSRKWSRENRMILASECRLFCLLALFRPEKHFLKSLFLFLGVW